MVETERHLAEAKVYWQKALTGFTAATSLLVEQKGSHQPAVSVVYGRQKTTLANETLEALRRFEQHHGLDLETLIQGAWAVLLSRYSGEIAVLFGSTLTERLDGSARVEPIPDEKVKPLPLRVAVDAQERVGTWLKRLQEQRSVICHYGGFSLAQLKTWGGISPARSLFESILAFGDAANALLEVDEDGRSIRSSASLEEISSPLVVLVRMREGLTLELVYSRDRFSEDVIRRMLGHLETLLEGIVASPEQRLSELPLLTAGEQQLLAEWNETEREYPEAVCLHELFEKQVASRPDAVAVVFHEERLSYRELNRRANQLAHYLRGVGVGPEVQVGIVLERSVAMIVGLLGVLKAGGAYVPLDPQYPVERLGFMIEDAELGVLITQEELRERVGGAAVSQVIVIEEESWNGERTENPGAGVSGANLAYVIYTSGSTGRPKGVGIEHHSAATLLYWAGETFSAEELQGVLASTSICFDLSVFELFVPLSWGGQVLLAEHALALPNLAAKGEVRLINTVPSVISELVRMQAIPAEVRVVNLAGEALRRPLVEQLYEQPTIARVVNLYGPSEDTTYSTSAVMRRGDAGRVVIGRPIAKTQAYVVDGRGLLVPIGVAGELCLGGAGLARGYLKRAELTAEKFVPDGLSGQSGRRLYRTGDLTRYLADGNIEYLGRIDQQLKIRGFRIEPGEIEARLRQHEVVREALVMVQEEPVEDKRLVAYVVAEPEMGLTEEALRRYLRKMLPEYMIPSTFVLLSEMPLTPNGKINRQALLALAQNGDEHQAAFVAPRDALELRLGRLWEDVLNVRPIGITDNFFDLGGHSLLAVRMMSQLSRQIGRELPLALILQKQTIQELGAHLRQQVGPQATSPLVAIQWRGWKQPFFCVHPAGGSIICYSALSRHLGTEQPFYGIQTPGLDGPIQKPLTRIESMAARYIEELQTVQSAGPYMLGGWSLGGVVAFEMARQLRGQGLEVSLLALIDSYAPATLGGSTEISDETLLLQFTSDISGLYGLEQSLKQESTSEPRTVEERLTSLLQHIVRQGWAPPDLDLKQLSRLFQVFQTNMCALLRYEPQRYPGRITFFRASEQLADISLDPASDWRNLAADGVEVHVVPGDHYTMLREPAVQVMAEWLKVCLDLTGSEMKPALGRRTVEVANAISV